MPGKVTRNLETVDMLDTMAQGQCMNKKKLTVDSYQLNSDPTLKESTFVMLGSLAWQGKCMFINVTAQEQPKGCVDFLRNILINLKSAPNGNVPGFA